MCQSVSVISQMLFIELAKKFVYLFPHDGSNSALLSQTSFETILLDYIVTAVISACILKNLSKLVNFCAAILTEDRRRYTTLLA